MNITFDERKAVALSILSHEVQLSRRAGSFLGQCVVDDTPLTEKQLAWLLILAERAGVEIPDHA